MPNDGLNYKSKNCTRAKNVCECVCAHVEAYFCTELQLHRIPMRNLHKYLWNCDIDWVPHLKGKSHTLATFFETLFCSHNIWLKIVYSNSWVRFYSVCASLADKGRFRSPPIDFQSSKTLKFGIKKNYWKIIGKGQISPNCTRPTGSCNFDSLVIIMWLPIQILLLYWSCINLLVKRLPPHTSC